MTLFIYCSPDRSYCICGPNLKGVGNDDFYGTRSSFGVQIVQVSFLETLKLGELVDFLPRRVWSGQHVVYTCRSFGLGWVGVGGWVRIFVLFLSPCRPELNHLVVSNNTCVMEQKIMFAVVIFCLSWSTFGHRSPLIVLVFRL